MFLFTILTYKQVNRVSSTDKMRTSEKILEHVYVEIVRISIVSITGVIQFFPNICNKLFILKNVCCHATLCIYYVYNIMITSLTKTHIIWSLIFIFSFFTCRTPLHCAASCNNLAMVRFLVEHGACIFATTLSDQETAAEKCEEDEEGFDGCSEFLYSEYNYPTTHSAYIYHAIRLCMFHAFCPTPNRQKSCRVDTHQCTYSEDVKHLVDSFVLSSK